MKTIYTDYGAQSINPNNGTMLQCSCVHTLSLFYHQTRIQLHTYVHTDVTTHISDIHRSIGTHTYVQVCIHAHLVFLEQWSAHVLVQTVSEVIPEAGQPLLQLVRLLRVVYRVDKEVDEPGQRVLVHGLYVGQVSDGEEEDWGVDSYWFVAHASLVNLSLSFLCHCLWGVVAETLIVKSTNCVCVCVCMCACVRACVRTCVRVCITYLLLLDLIGENLWGWKDFNSRFIFQNVALWRRQNL